MKKINFCNDYLLLNNRLESEEYLKQESIKDSPDIDEFEKYVKAPSIKDSDIQLFIQELNDLPCCLNNFLEKIIKTPKGLFQLLEIRKRNIKIKVYTSVVVFDNNILCKWCKEICEKDRIFEEKEINFDETNSKICSCGIENHEFFRQKTNLTSILDNEEVNDIFTLIKDYRALEKKDLIKEKIDNLIKGEDNDKILQIFSYIYNIYETSSFFNSLDYNDSLYSKMFSCLKKNKNYSNFNNYG